MISSMTGLSWVLLGLVAVSAIGDWVAVGRANERAEHLFKPLTLMLLIAAAVSLNPADGTVRWLFVAALCCGLLGDVLLMLDRFVPGAAAFLVGHVFYIAGFLQVPLNPWTALAALVPVAALILTAGRRIAAGAAQRSSLLGRIVLAYQLVLCAVFVLAVGSGNPWAIAGAGLFAASDTMLGWNRFVSGFPGARVLIHVTYHLAQALLVLSLLTLG